MRRTLRPRQPLDLSCTLRMLRRGVGDPTMRIADGEVWRATRTPSGPASVHFGREGAEIVVSAWGPGSEWLLDRAPQLVGLDDNPQDFRPRHQFLRQMHGRHPGLRFGASGAVVEALVCSILEQKVRGIDAWRTYRRLVLRYSDPAPGPGNLMLPPDPAVLSRLG
ncbi:MAG TPA: DNA-3-methyladenine glycosylase 2 family protein, partial [Actinomycetota bacterium]|nr:DNA-3-methyladenine glycosylase 2 family protein [Actinomycetota bacterium]